MDNGNACPLIVIPALNEERTVGDVVRSLHALNYTVLVVNDHSSDGTSLAAAAATVIDLPINLGVGGALKVGFRYALDHGFSSVVQIDADGQHPVHQISNLISAANSSGAHLVIGSRYLSADTTLNPTLPRRLSMWGLSRLASRLAGIRLTDTTSGFRLIQQPLLQSFADEFPSYYLGDTFEATIAALRGGYKVIEIPASLSPRIHGKSSVSTMQAMKLVAKVLVIALTGLHPQVRKLREYVE